ncbi:hypothetical protein LCGC14_2651050 [marine sediment metagenome]|uniref:HTH cro/C1-type domain-containing protein n=1 Tax=marine sediment metagenome TaxID=412755 RepID=A0A0F8ZUS6_9ZZZZ
MTLIKPSKRHFTVNGTEFVAARERVGLTQTQFGKLCGWGKSCQCHLEQPGDHEITSDTANKIIGVVSGKG